jgi:hypothetical protein
MFISKTSEYHIPDQIKMYGHQLYLNIKYN